MFNPEFQNIQFDQVDGASSLDAITTNWQTAAAAGLTVASGGVAGAIMLAAFPAQTLSATAGIGALAYAGKRRAEGKDAFPFLTNLLSKNKEDNTEEGTAPAAA